MESEDVYCYCFWKKSNNCAWKIFQGKVNIGNEMWTCEWKVSNSIGKGVNKTVSERLQRKWLKVRYKWECVKAAANCTSSAYIRNKFKKNLKNRTFRSYPFKNFPA
jgi:hypothetical protein